jgi:starvation-inducible DNA-binding protein
MEPKSQSGMAGRAKDTIARILDHVLKEECSLSATTRAYRWKVTGPNLYSLHRLFDEQRRQLDYWLNQVVERTKATGLFAGFRPEEIVQDAARKERTSGNLPAGTIIGDLLARHEAMARQLRGDVERLGDPATAELLTRLIEFHETTAWMLRMVQPGAGSEPAV